MGDDWQVGDLALCVRSGNHTRTGHIYTVNLVAVGAYGPVLRFDERMHCEEHRRQMSLATRFRKIRPHTEDAEDRETIALLTGKPVLEPANV